MAKKNDLEHTSTMLGSQNMKSSQRMVSVVEPYELPAGWKWVRQRYSHTDDSVFPNRKDFVRLRCKLTEDWTLLRKV